MPRRLRSRVLSWDRFATQQQIRYRPRQRGGVPFRGRRVRRQQPAGTRLHDLPQYTRTALAVQLLPEDDGNDSARMGILDHLDELRRILQRLLIGNL